MSVKDKAKALQQRWDEISKRVLDGTERNLLSELYGEVLRMQSTEENDGIQQAEIEQAFRNKLGQLHSAMAGREARLKSNLEILKESAQGEAETKLVLALKDMANAFNDKSLTEKKRTKLQSTFHENSEELRNSIERRQEWLAQKNTQLGEIRTQVRGQSQSETIALRSLEETYQEIVSGSENKILADFKRSELQNEFEVTYLKLKNSIHTRRDKLESQKSQVAGLRPYVEGEAELHLLTRLKAITDEKDRVYTSDERTYFLDEQFDNHFEDLLTSIKDRAKQRLQVALLRDASVKVRDTNSVLHRKTADVKELYSALRAASDKSSPLRTALEQDSEFSGNLDERLAAIQTRLAVEKAPADVLMAAAPEDASEYNQEHLDKVEHALEQYDRHAYIRKAFQDLNSAGARTDELVAAKLELVANNIAKATGFIEAARLNQRLDEIKARKQSAEDAATVKREKSAALDKLSQIPLATRAFAAKFSGELNISDSDSPAQLRKKMLGAINKEIDARLASRHEAEAQALARMEDNDVGLSITHGPKRGFKPVHGKYLDPNFVKYMHDALNKHYADAVSFGYKRDTENFDKVKAFKATASGKDIKFAIVNGQDTAMTNDSAHFAALIKGFTALKLANPSLVVNVVGKNKKLMDTLRQMCNTEGLSLGRTSLKRKAEAELAPEAKRPPVVPSSPT